MNHYFDQEQGGRFRKCDQKQIDFMNSILIDGTKNLDLNFKENTMHIESIETKF